MERAYLPEHGSGIEEPQAFGGPAVWSVALTYDEHSNLTRRVDSRNIVTNYDYAYDPFDRLQRVSYDATGHDKPGERSGPVRAEPRGHLQLPGGRRHPPRRDRDHDRVCTRTFSYDPNFGLTSVSIAMHAAPGHAFTVGYGHDALGRRTSVTYPDRDDPAGTRAVLTSPMGLGGLPVTVSSSDFGPVASAITRTASGLASSITVPGSTETYLYAHADARLLTEQKVTTTGGADVLHLAYDYGPLTTAAAGNVHPVKAATNLLDATRNRAISYDRLGQISVVSGGAGGWTQTYRFDARGNRTTVKATGEAAPGTPMPSDGEPLIVYDDENGIKPGSGLKDRAGNLMEARIGSGDCRFVYDTAGRLSWAFASLPHSEEVRLGFVYGPDNHLLATVRLKLGSPFPLPGDTTPGGVDAKWVESVTIHVWDRDQIVAEYTADGAAVDDTLHWSQESYHLGGRLIVHPHLARRRRPGASLPASGGDWYEAGQRRRTRR
ncbi:MAG: hypothetical protein ACR2LI_01430 [Propionibacteriaceae bacterium]